MKTILATALATFLSATPVIAAEYVSFLDYPQPTDSKDGQTWGVTNRRSSAT